jgi:hypothetical protein
MASSIPVVIIAYNNLTFVRSFVKQILRITNRIIIVDNCSTYPAILEYYEDIQKEFSSNIEIRRKDRNYGHNVVLRHEIHTLPAIFALSDPDLKLNDKMPDNCLDILLEISNTYKYHRVGLALDLSDRDLFIKRIHPATNKTIYDGEIGYWSNRIHNDKYELYNAPIDTTFCLINQHHPANGLSAIRVAGDFVCKHLPWYENYLNENIPEIELTYWKNNNISSMILNIL